MPDAAAQSTQFGKFRLLGRIGEGGMGVVYRAEIDSPEGPRQVVLKRMRPELTREPSLVRMMAQEARLGALLRHPSLVPVIETGEIDGELYLVLPYVDGYDLAQILDRAIRVGKQVPVGVACWLAMQAAEALEYVHALRDERGQAVVIAHRDISPANLMVTRDGNVKLLDFGIAKASEHVALEQTRTGTMKGKFAYFSPEQANGLPLDARSDLFSLGILLMELLLQRRLFRGNGDFDTLRRVREVDVQRPSVLRGEIDDELDRVLLRVMKRDREERFSSARELVAALQPVVRRYGGGPEATRSYLAALGPIERRTSAAGSYSDVQPPELEEGTARISVTPIRPEDVTHAPPSHARSKKRSFFGRERMPTPTPVEPPSQIAQPTVPEPPLPAGMPRWKAYLQSLPDGVRSFPQCTTKAAIVRNFSDHFGHPKMPPDAPSELHDLVENPPLVSSYVSGVLCRLFFLALADVLGVDDDTFVERSYAGNAQLLASPLYRILFMVMSTQRLVKNIGSQWKAFHHGITLEVRESDDRHALAVLHSPPGFEPTLVLRMHATGMRAGVEAVGARNVRTSLDLVAPGEAHVHVSWDP